MPNNLDLIIEKWCAWAPGIETQQEWVSWAKNDKKIDSNGTPDVSFVPAMLRRRLSLLSRMALNVANGCLQPEQSIRTIFCSRHGELHRTVSLLQSIAVDELLSPMAFSLSVPNTASGLYSIARKDTAASTALSAGMDSFEQALVEAASLINSGKEEKLLLIVCEQLLPEVFSQYSEPQEQNDFAVAFLLTSQEVVEQNKENSYIKVNLSFEKNKEAANCFGLEPRALHFLRFILNEQMSMTMNASRLTWKYIRHVS